MNFCFSVCLFLCWDNPNVCWQLVREVLNVCLSVCFCLCLSVIFICLFSKLCWRTLNVCWQRVIEEWGEFCWYWHPHVLYLVEHIYATYIYICAHTCIIFFFTFSEQWNIFPISFMMNEKLTSQCILSRNMKDISFTFFEIDRLQ